MYLPSHFEETRPAVLHDLVRAHPLGVLVTLGGGGLEANHLPFELDPEPAPLGTLRAHVSRANPVWQDVTADVEALVIFQGPQAYVTPAWYETKRESGRVVPTYNYAVVHAYGRLRVVEDRDWLRGLVTRLTDRFEAGRADRWRVTDAPEEFVERMLGGIVGLELPVSRMLGKWKVSQNRPAPDRAGVVRGLRAETDPAARAMADLVERAGDR
ncbi:MAG TPA: FMN-binding negative transcriptional regulator [Candidatus Tectomicrobia bacterium]|nr:FMN-binding negative transcriptional regulator [Candidatus Tectomicrobia bacterium]